MRRMSGVWAVLLLLCVLEPASAQEAGDRAQNSQGNGFQIEQNYPNPFNPETTIPFTLGEELFVDGRPAVVTIRIFNILTQLVAYPAALRHSAGEGVAVDQLEYMQPGRYEAYWDGTDSMGRQVASGIYLMQLSVNGLKPLTRKMYVMK
jgi:ABC-type dipeptide/oligopeptide/nickel transport system permease subunit